LSLPIPIEDRHNDQNEQGDRDSEQVFVGSFCVFLHFCTSISFVGHLREKADSEFNKLHICLGSEQLFFTLGAKPFWVHSFYGNRYYQQSAYKQPKGK